MIARITALALPLILFAGITPPPATAGDFGVSFHYGHGSRYYSSTPRYYSRCTTRYYTPRVATYAYYEDPVDHVYYDDPTDYAYCDDYVAPVTYVERPRAVVYDTCYPPMYRTTYTRSYYKRPTYRHVSVRSGGHHERYVRRHTTYRRSAPRPSIRVYSGGDRRNYVRSGLSVRVHSGDRSHYRHTGKYDRYRGSRYHRDVSRHRSHRAPTRVRVYRR